MYGYVIIDNDYWYLIRDPLPEDYGSSYLMSFEKLCNGQNALPGEETDVLLWEGSILLNTP